jgi:hypothetical protein
MEKRIELIFNKATTRLAGNPYGKDVYDKQVKNKIDFSRVNVISFPENIEKVASSFVQGFFSEIIKEVGYIGFQNIIILDIKNESLKKEIMRDLFS